MEPFPQRPDPGLRIVWFLRGLFCGLALSPVGWLLLLPAGYLLVQAGLDLLPAYLVAAASLVVAGVAGMWAWTGVAIRNYSFELGPHEVRIRRGVWIRSEVRVPLVQLQAVAVRNGPLLGWLGLATLQLRPAPQAGGGPAWHEMRLEGLRNADAAATALLARVEGQRAPSTAGSRAPRPGVSSRAGP